MRYGGGRYAEFGVGSITYAMKARSALDAAVAERTMRSAGIVYSVITRPSG